MGLDGFRRQMLSDNRFRIMVDYPNAKDCFPQNSIGGGVCYFLWDRDNPGTCTFTNHRNNTSTTRERDLNEFQVFVRYNEAVDVIHKVMSFNEPTLQEIVSSLSPFGIGSSARGKESFFPNAIKLHSSKGVGHVSLDEIPQGHDYINKYKIMMSKVTSEHAGEPGKDGKFKVISKIHLLGPSEVCTFSYFLIGNYESVEFAENLLLYLKTKFVRFLLLQAISSINISKDKFCFIPIQDFSKTWSDEDLFNKYGLTTEEIEFIESIIRPFGGDNDE
jgi:site-specific DNA-methyltransferase (adenine-specific)